MKSVCSFVLGVAACLPFFVGAAVGTPLSFEGETFGRILSDDVEPKKLARPIGVIDEVMLQSDGGSSRRLTTVFAQKYLENASRGEASEAAEAVCQELMKRYGWKLASAAPVFREGFRKILVQDAWYALVTWQSNFFQQIPVLGLEIGLLDVREPSSSLTVTDVMGERFAMEASGDDRPKRPFWKFDRVVRQCGKNRRTDGVYGVYDVSALSREESRHELDEARRRVESLHGVKLRRTFDSADVVRYDFAGQHVVISVKLEYLRQKQIRYSVLACGVYAELIHALPLPGFEGLWVRRGVLALCAVALCLGLWLLLVRFVRRQAEQPTLTPLVPGFVGVVAFVSGAVVMQTILGVFDGDPIFGKDAVCFRSFHAVLFGGLCAVSGLALLRIRLASSRCRYVVWTLGLLEVAFVSHLVVAMAYYGGGVSVVAAVNGYLLRCRLLGMLMLIAGIIHLFAFGALYGCWPTLRRKLGSLGMGPARYLRSGFGLIVQIGLVGLAVYEMTLLATFVSRY